jgi:hypothetical protein
MKLIEVPTLAPDSRYTQKGLRGAAGAGMGVSVSGSGAALWQSLRIAAATRGRTASLTWVLSVIACFLQLSLEPRSMCGEHPSIADERCDNHRAARLGTICPDVLNLSDYPHSS